MTKKRKFIRCSDVAKHVCENLDSEIDQKKCLEIKKHLTDCPNCYAYLDSIKKTIHLYKVEKTPSVTARARKELFAVLKVNDS
jgi:anti-sigma factor RsiW